MRLNMHQDAWQALHFTDHLVDPVYEAAAFLPFLSTTPFFSVRTDLKFTPVKGFRVSLWYDVLPQSGPNLQQNTLSYTAIAPDTGVYPLGSLAGNLLLWKYNRGGVSVAATLGDSFTVTLSAVDHTEEITGTANNFSTLGRPFDAFAGALSNQFQNRTTYRFTDQELHLEIRPLKTLPVAPSFKLSAIQTSFEYIKLANPTTVMIDPYSGGAGYNDQIGWEQKKLVPTFNGTLRIQPMNPWWFQIGYSMTWFSPGLDTSFADPATYDNLRNALTLDAEVTVHKRLRVQVGYRFDWFQYLQPGYSAWRTYPWGAPYDVLLTQPLDKTLLGERNQSRSSAYFGFVFR